MDVFSKLEGFGFHLLDIRFYPTDNIQMPYWIGAVIRNRFLYAAERVYDESGRSLYQLLETLPLPAEHPYFKSYAGGFPKGFLFDCSRLPDANGKFALKKDRIYTFSLVLVGKCADYYPLFMQALIRMADIGFGYPMTPLVVVDVCERDGEMLYHEGDEYLLPLSQSVVWLPDCTYRCPLTVTLRLKTPVCLIGKNRKNGREGGYQGKLNQFPSLYQFVRSAAYRLFALHMLYVNPESLVPSAEEMEDCIRQAEDAVLLEANLHCEKRRSTPRVGEKNVYAMQGYCGTMTFGEVDARLLPLLGMCSYLGIGNDINFGLGQFEISCTNS